MNKSLKKINFVLIIAVACIIVVFTFFAYQKNAKNMKIYRDARVEIVGEVIALDVAQTPLERKRGLSGRTELCEQCGMWFVFDEVAKHSFWMKDMLFDIDIIWIRDGHVVHIEENISHTEPKKTYAPPAPASHVLELPAGKVRDLDVTSGTAINTDIL